MDTGNAGRGQVPTEYCKPDPQTSSASPLLYAALVGIRRFIENRGVTIGSLVLALAAVAACVAVYLISTVNGWWVDELFSIWATDPAQTFRQAFSSHFLPDPTPPLYYYALFIVRHFIADERSAIVALNVGVIAAGIFTVAVVSRKFQSVGLALAASAVLLLSGPVLRYVVEGRAYLMALVLTFIASWLCALVIEGSGRRQNIASFAFVGVLAGLTHLYAGFFCCCLSAGLIALWIVNHRLDLLKPAIVLGASSAIVSLAWIAAEPNRVTPANWIDFSLHSFMGTIWEVKQLAFGSLTLLLIFLIASTVSLSLRATRPLSFAFGLSVLLFFAVPVAVSLRYPILVGRYWLIGAPSIIVFTAFVARSNFVQSRSEDRWHLHLVCAIGALLFLLVADASGFHQARNFTASKPIWTGAVIVAPLSVKVKCPAASVHVNTNVWFFAFAAQVPETIFTTVRPYSSDAADPATSGCPVLGWAEHVLQGDDFLQNASDEELLRYLNVHASPSSVTIVRHSSGFVVLRRTEATTHQSRL